MVYSNIQDHVTIPNWCYFRAQQLKQEDEEERARLAREKLKERRVADDLPVEKPAPIIEPGNPSPYGKWQTIKET